MKPFPDPLDRLLNAAARAPSRPPDELPVRVVTRTLAAWRAPRLDESGLALLTLFRRGLALAGALAAVSVALSIWEMHRATPDIWNVPDTVFNVASLQ